MSKALDQFFDRKGHTADDSYVKYLRDHLLRQTKGKVFRSQDGLQHTLDAKGALFSARSLEYVETQLYKVKYAEYKTRDVFPINRDASQYHDALTYRFLDSQGEAGVMSDDSTGEEAPLVSLSGDEITNKIIHFFAAYQFNIIQLGRAQMLGIPLSPESAKAARKSIENSLDKLAWYGNSAKGIEGFLTNPAIDVTTADVGAGGTTFWKDKTTDERIADVKSNADKIRSLTNGVESADTLLLPIDQYGILTNPRESTDTSGMNWILGNLPDIKTIEWVPQLKGAGAGGTNRMVLYKKDEDVLDFAIPFDIFAEPAQLRGMAWKTILRAATAGVRVKRPKSVLFVDGI